ncbi:hypothetical protein [Cohnella laeviribosi]|uniref:hypothetical protein n=1 Tax=Cohnella laeviribosi TaxID=380174 RepID=UPI003D22BD47
MEVYLFVSERSGGNAVATKATAKPDFARSPDLSVIAAIKFGAQIAGPGVRDWGCLAFFPLAGGRRLSVRHSVAALPLVNRADFVINYVASSCQIQDFYLRKISTYIKGE